MTSDIGEQQRESGTNHGVLGKINEWKGAAYHVIEGLLVFIPPSLRTAMVALLLPTTLLVSKAKATIIIRCIMINIFEG
jgi:hypothetical protein